ncbi:alpha/beta fold hydrolase [Dictyobacter kobayashii]|uniref:AB hydrolase-1 domain-containing protein n=1 Tax=Dictyobacter kobayashii TaxID=2014872 RepID=A0A402AUX8_9CHLR|nr:alpha/beta hydrolase [Dictyobacter kobayashii]GCE22940.1 hypothetical protein KDK_67400 [Dictyobacter kobayashii]
MAQWRESTINANGIKIHYYQTGDAQKPAIILLHGVTDSGLCWKHIAHVLEDDYTVIMPDARGHGHSDGLATGFAYEALAADVAGLIQALNLERPYLLGHSMGGMTALTVAAQYPELVRAILLEDPPLVDRAENSTNNGSRPSPMANWLAGLKQMTRDELLASVRTENPKWDEEEYEPWVDAKIDVDPAVFQQIRSLQQSWRELAANVECPVLLITGDNALHAIVTPQIAQDALQYWRYGQLAHIAGTGHNIRRDNYSAFIQATTAFLHSV